MPERKRGIKAGITVDDRQYQEAMARAQKEQEKLAKGAGETGKALQLLERIAQGAGAVTTKAFAAAGAGARAVLNPIRTAGNAFDGLASRAEAFNKKADATNKKFADIRTAAHHLAPGLQTAGAALERFGNISSNAIQGATVAAAGGIAAVTAAGTALAARGVDMNLTVGGAEAAFTKLAGSADRAHGFVMDLRKEAETSAPTFKELLGTSQSLAAVYIEKFGPGGLGRVIPTIRAFADAAAILRVDSSGMDFALGGFRQLAASASPTLEDIKQVDENLPGAGVRGIVKKAFGTDDAEGLKAAHATGMMVADAIVKGMQEKFGGAQLAAAGTLPVLMSNMQDALDNLGAKTTVGLTASLTKGAKTVLDTISKATEGGTGRTLTLIFDSVGRGVEGLTAKLPALVGWLDKVFEPRGVAEFASNALALLQTLGEEFGKLVGLDLGKLMDPAKAGEFFNAFGEGVHNAINAVFGLVRAWEELKPAVRSFVLDTRNQLTDWGQDTLRTVQGLFLGAQQSVEALAASVLDSFLRVGRALNILVESLNAGLDYVGDSLNAAIRSINNSPLTKWFSDRGAIPEIKIGGGIPALNLGGLERAQTAATKGALATAEKIAKLQQDQEVAASNRYDREAGRDREDPRRHQSFGQRLGDAFAGRTGDMGPQNAFWDRFERNAANIGKFFFGRRAEERWQAITPPSNFLGRYPDAPRSSVTTGEATRDASGVFHPASPGAVFAVPSASGVSASTLPADAKELKKFQDEQKKRAKQQRDLRDAMFGARWSSYAEGGDSGQGALEGARVKLQDLLEEQSQLRQSLSGLKPETEAYLQGWTEYYKLEEQVNKTRKSIADGEKEQLDKQKRELEKRARQRPGVDSPPGERRGHHWRSAPTSGAVSSPPRVSCWSSS